MKQELPLAVVLLAVGCMLVVSNSWTNFWPEKTDVVAHTNLAENQQNTEAFSQYAGVANAQFSDDSSDHNAASSEFQPSTADIQSIDNQPFHE